MLSVLSASSIRLCILLLTVLHAIAYVDEFVWDFCTLTSSINEYRNNNVTSKDDIDYIYKPLSQWTDDELKLYINNIDNDNPEYSYKSLGFHNIKEIVQFNFQVRKEKKNREYRARYIIK